jgi:hypothetical protein
MHHRLQHRWTENETEDPAMVLAIFPGSPYCIITDAGADRASRFESPFLATPISVVLFQPSTSD